MKINLHNAGKRFNREWIFRHLTYSFSSGNQYAITGSNGSGKSTLLQVIAGAVLQSEGKMEYLLESDKGNLKPILIQDPYYKISIAAPYLELIEEMTATEFLTFHSKFKKLNNSIPAILSAIGLADAALKQIRYFSSGMKQRLKLGQAFFSETEVLLLDEPSTNLDEDGILLYRKLLEEHTNNRIVIISSNDPQEYAICKEVIRMAEFK